MPDQPQLPRPAPLTPDHPKRQEPGVYPGQGAPEVPNKPGPEHEMPTRRGRPGRDIPRYPEQPGRDFPMHPPGRVDQPESPGFGPPQKGEPPPVIGPAD